MFPAVLQVLPIGAAEDLAVGEHRHCLTGLQVPKLGPEHALTGECGRTDCSGWKGAPDGIP